MTHNLAQRSPPPGGGYEHRNSSIDWMRVICILYITGFWHLLDNTSFASAHHIVPFYQFTVAALSLFVFLSGYLLGRTPIDINRAGLLNFYVRRLLRIYPPYLLALLLFGVVGLASVRTLLKASVLISMVDGPAPQTLWFITMIMVFYISVPFLRALCHRPIVLATVAALCWGSFATGWAATNRFDVRPLLYWPSFVLGLSFASRRVLLSRTVVAFLVLAVASGSWLSTFSQGPTDLSLWSVPLAWSAAPLIFLLLNKRLPNVRGITAVALGSYFLYLIHKPVFILTLSLTNLPIISPWRLPALLMIWLITIPVAIYSQKLYDLLLDSWRGVGGK